MASDQLAIRRATPADVQSLVRLYRRAYGENERRGFPSSMTELEPSTVHEWLDARRVFVAATDGMVVGAVQLIPRPDWGVPELGRLAVSPAFQRRGLGDRLLAFGERAAKEDGHERLRLRTLGGHPVLADWYRRRGYERVDVEPLPDRPFDAPILETEL